MGRPRKNPDAKLACAPLRILPNQRTAAQSLAVELGVSESEVNALAHEAGLPHVPKLLERKRRAKAKAAQKNAPASNVLPFAGAEGEKPTTGIEPVTYGLRNSLAAALGGVLYFPADQSPTGQVDAREVTTSPLTAHAA